MAMAPPPKDPGVAPADHHDLVRRRDAFVTSMTMLRNAAEEASRAGLAYFDIIAMGSSAANGANISSLRAMSVPPISAINHVLHVDDPDTPGDGRRKRKRNMKPKDPNAPKKPATPYFLFCSSARENVKRDLGENAQFQDVQNELKNRWEALGQDQKKGWSELYQRLLGDWKAEKEQYDINKAGALGGVPPTSTIPITSSSLPVLAPAPAPTSGFTAVNQDRPISAPTAEESEEEPEQEEEEEEPAAPEPAPQPEPEPEAAVSSDSSLSPPPKEKEKPKRGRKPKAVVAEATSPKKPGRKPRAKRQSEPEAEVQLQAEAQANDTPKRKGRKRRKSGAE